MRIGFYYSLVDWRFPGVLPIWQSNANPEVYAPMIEQAHAQVRELLTNYGKIDILWYDVLTPADPELWRSKSSTPYYRELQPGYPDQQPRGRAVISKRRKISSRRARTPGNRVTP